MLKSLCIIQKLGIRFIGLTSIIFIFSCESGSFSALTFEDTSFLDEKTEKIVPISGLWTGWNISFNISSDGSEISSGTVTFLFRSSWDGEIRQHTDIYLIGVPINDMAFSYEYGDCIIKGEFLTPTSAKGTASLTDEVYDPPYGWETMTVDFSWNANSSN